jgi:hypothetical protein
MADQKFILKTSEGLIGVTCEFVGNNVTMRFRVPVWSVTLPVDVLDDIQMLATDASMSLSPSMSPSPSRDCDDDAQ